MWSYYYSDLIEFSPIYMYRYLLHCITICYYA